MGSACVLTSVKGERAARFCPCSPFVFISTSIIADGGELSAICMGANILDSPPDGKDSLGARSGACVTVMWQTCPLMSQRQANRGKNWRIVQSIYLYRGYGESSMLLPLYVVDLEQDSSFRDLTAFFWVFFAK